MWYNDASCNNAEGNMNTKIGNKAYRRIRSAVAMLAILLLAGMLGGCGTKVSPIKGTKEELAVVGMVTDDAGNSYDILYEEFRYVTLLYQKSIAKTYGHDDVAIWQDADFAAAHEKELEDAVFSNLRNNYAILQLCKFYEIDTESKDVDKQVQSDLENMVENDFGGKMDKYKEFLAENNLTDHYLRFLLANNFLESAVFYAMADNKLYIEYNASNIKDFQSYVLNDSNYCRTLAVYLSCKTEADKTEKRETAAKIASELQGIQDKNERFSKFRQYFGSSVNDDLSMTTTKGYYFTRGEMDEAYEEAAFALDMYGISNPVETSGGYYVIIRLPLEELYVEQNIETLLKNYQSVTLGKVEDAYRNALTFTCNDTGKQYKLTDIR